MTTPVVDAHHHLWDPAHADYPWMTDELAAIRRRFDVDDLVPSLDAAGVDATVLVQARSSAEESRELLATASGWERIAGVVAWVDLANPAVGDELAALRDGPGGDRLVGIRHQVHDEPDPEWLTRDDVRRGIAAVADADLAYDLLVRSRELPAARALVASMPDARFVVDHLAKPPIRTGALQPWADLVSAWADLPNAAWKLSGLVTEADWEDWTPDDLVPYVDHALSTLGPDRLIFGSDWPVCTLAASYAQVVEAARLVTGRCSDAERDAIFAGNAKRVYWPGSEITGRDG